MSRYQAARTRPPVCAGETDSAQIRLSARPAGRRGANGPATGGSAGTEWREHAM